MGGRQPSLEGVAVKFTPFAIDGPCLVDLEPRSDDRGLFARTFCEDARFFRPENGARIDAIRQAIEPRREHPHFPIWLTSLIEAADRVDSTTGVQMAYLKEWAPRAHGRLTLRIPDLLPGPGLAIRGDAVELVPTLGAFDFAYLDPPYNQHRYEANYHLWETLVAWDAPEPYGVARKRLELSDRALTSAFNRRRLMPEALRECVDGVDARVVVISYNDESWIEIDELIALGRTRGAVEIFGFDSKRYVGAQIGIHGPKGGRVGEVSHLRNTEYVMVCGETAAVETASRALTALAESGASGTPTNFRRGGAKNSRPGP